jgi:hypothetical protein
LSVRLSEVCESSGQNLTLASVCACRYRNKGNIASLLNIDQLHARLKHAIADMDGLIVTFQAAQERSLEMGLLHLDTFVQVTFSRTITRCVAASEMAGFG